MFEVLITIFAACNLPGLNGRSQLECRNLVIDCTEERFMKDKAKTFKDAAVYCVRNLRVN